MSRVLYVEDEAMAQIYGEASLNDAGYDVVVASSGQEASAYLREHGAEIDALITDIDLPGAVNGWRIAELGREITKALAVVYVTGAAAKDFKARGVPRGILFPKPLDWDDLIVSLSALAPA